MLDSAHQRLSNHCKLSKTEFPRYLMHVMVSRQEVNVANKNVFFELWHKRLGHMSQKGWDILVRKNILLEVTRMYFNNSIDYLDVKDRKENPTI